MLIKRHFTKHNLNRALAAGIVINVIYILYLAFFPFKSAEFNNVPFPVNNSPITAGETLSYTVDYCRYTEEPVSINRTLKGPATFTVAVDIVRNDKGCFVRKVEAGNPAATVIPPQAPAGKYILHLRACYRFNPLQEDCHNLRTEEFEVKRPKGD